MKFLNFSFLSLVLISCLYADNKTLAYDDELGKIENGSAQFGESKKKSPKIVLKMSNTEETKTTSKEDILKDIDITDFSLDKLILKKDKDKKRDENRDNPTIQISKKSSIEVNRDSSKPISNKNLKHKENINLNFISNKIYIPYYDGEIIKYAEKYYVYVKPVMEGNVLRYSIKDYPYSDFEMMSDQRYLQENIKKIVDRKIMLCKSENRVIRIGEKDNIDKKNIRDNSCLIAPMQDRLERGSSEKVLYFD